MGLDACIYFKVKPEAQVVDCALDFNFPSQFSAVLRPEDSDYFPDGSTHKVETCVRYYGENYERGPWPLIAAVLMQLFASQYVEKVWYGHDCVETSEIKPEDVLRITAHYMANGHRPYLGH